MSERKHSLYVMWGYSTSLRHLQDLGSATEQGGNIYIAEKKVKTFFPKQMLLSGFFYEVIQYKYVPLTFSVF